MKRFVRAISLVMAIFVASLMPGPAQEASTPVQPPPANSAAANPLKVALLEWYQANTTTSFTVGKTQNSNPVRCSLRRGQHLDREQRRDGHEAAGQ